MCGLNHVTEWEWTVDSIWPWVSQRALIQLHLGFRGPHRNASQLKERVNRVMASITMPPIKGLSVWIPVQSIDNTIRFFPNPKPPLDIVFPRQTKAPFNCLADYVNPTGEIALFAVTAGDSSRVIASLIKHGQLADAVIAHALFVQVAEAAAELLHHQLRVTAGLDARNGLSESDMETTNYTGKRFSFGYGACPNLADQHLFQYCLPLEQIGITLTQTHMLTPESSVTAMVFNHPNATYFSAV